MNRREFVKAGAVIVLCGTHSVPTNSSLGVGRNLTAFVPCAMTPGVTVDPYFAEDGSVVWSDNKWYAIAEWRNLKVGELL